MKSYLYYISCITNLHVGSGDINFNIVDKEVEKDPVTGLPTIHSSGLKGAIRDYCKAKGMAEDVIKKLFGQPGTKDAVDTAGLLKFTDAGLVFRMMRASGNYPSLGVTTAAAVNHCVRTADALGCKPADWETVGDPETLGFSDGSFLCSQENLRIEGEATGILDDQNVNVFRKILQTNVFGIAKTFDGYDLPVIARNSLKNGKSDNLWYEEFVPHGSRFWFIVLAPDDVVIDEAIPANTVIQFGGNASIGCGFCKVNKIGEGSLS